MRPSRVQFTLGRLMGAVAVAGVGCFVLFQVPGGAWLAPAGLAALLAMLGIPCGFACLGVLFSRLSLPTVHPLSDHAVGYHDREPPEADPGIVFEPDRPPHLPSPDET